MGDVLVAYDVGADGSPTNVRLLHSSGFGRLDRAALDCVAQHWRNTPALKNGMPVASKGHEAIIRFTLSGFTFDTGALARYQAPTAGARTSSPAPVADTGTFDAIDFGVWTIGSLAAFGWLVRWTRLFVFRRRDCTSCGARNRSVLPFTPPGYCSRCGTKFSPAA